MIPRAISIFSVLFAVIATAAPARASDDPFTSRQWALRKVRAEGAWAIGKGKGITIAIVDTGVDTKHEDLKGSFVGGYDFVDNDPDPSDEQGHGTHVAGIAAARANNGLGVAGVAPEAKIMPVRVLNENGSGSGADIDAGVRWAVDHGADVVNLSLSDEALVEAATGGSLADTVEYAWSKGAIPVLAAGNGGLFRTEFQGAHAMIVTATTTSDAKASYATSVGFARWGLSAPGGMSSEDKKGMVYSTIWDRKGVAKYAWAAGTSMAAPHVSGAAAVLRGLGLTPEQTVDRILQTARNIGDEFTFGHGLLDVGAAAAAFRATGEKKGASSDRSAEPPAARTEPDDRVVDAVRPTITPKAVAQSTDVLVQGGTATPSSTTNALGEASAEDDRRMSFPLAAAALGLAATASLAAVMLLRSQRARA